MTTTVRKRKQTAPKQRPRAVATPLTDDYMRSGQWNPLWDQLRALDPAFVEAYLNFRETPQRNGPLPRHVKELILVAINAATTHLYAPGVRRHIANALRAGATREEVLETIQITTVMGIHSCNLAIPILCEEWERYEREVEGADRVGAIARKRGAARKR
jgi:alkylhydroperoxidase/carboxymuconolactone decarboxylase family protein YurZ